MKKVFVSICTMATMFAAAQNFTKLEINPLNGTEEYLFTDSARFHYGSGEFNAYTELNGKMLFSASSSAVNDPMWGGFTANDQLYISNGTASGTQLLKVINPSGPARISEFKIVNNIALFLADDNNDGFWDLWKTDGTSSGTEKIKSLNTPANYYLRFSGKSANKLVFCTQNKIISTDGTSTGTLEIGDASSYFSAGNTYCEKQNKVYFIAPNASSELCIWESNGTQTGTSILKNLSTAEAIHSVESMVSFYDKLYLTASVTAGGSDLFVFDFASNNLQRVAVSPIGTNSYPNNLLATESGLFFAASDMTHNNNLFVINPSHQLSLVSSTENIEVYGQLAFNNNRVSFCTGYKIYHVRTTDLQKEEHDLIGQGYSMNIYFGEWMIGFGSKMYLQAYDTATQQQLLLEHDYTNNSFVAKMPQQVTISHPFNFQLSCGIFDVFDFKKFGNKLVVPANFDLSGRELWLMETEVQNSLNEKNEEASFVLFPNPSNNQITIAPTNQYCNEEEMDVTILDMQSKIVAVSSKSVVDVSTLQNGTYLVKFKNEKAQGTRSLIISK